LNGLTWRDHNKLCNRSTIYPIKLIIFITNSYPSSKQITSISYARSLIHKTKLKSFTWAYLEWFSGNSALRIHPWWESLTFSMIYSLVVKKNSNHSLALRNRMLIYTLKWLMKSFQTWIKSSSNTTTQLKLLTQCLNG